jgi:hypothetical protein
VIKFTLSFFVSYLLRKSLSLVADEENPLLVGDLLSDEEREFFAKGSVYCLGQ